MLPNLEDFYWLGIWKYYSSALEIAADPPIASGSILNPYNLFLWAESRWWRGPVWWESGSVFSQLCDLGQACHLCEQFSRLHSSSLNTCLVSGVTGVSCPCSLSCVRSVVWGRFVCCLSLVFVTWLHLHHELVREAELFYFMDVKVRAQRGHVLCPWSHSC